MHGRRRADYKAEKSPAEKAKLEQKRIKYAKLSGLLLHLRKTFGVATVSQGDGTNGESSFKDIDAKLKKGLMLTEKLLVVNPGFYTIWNFRREMLGLQRKIITAHNEAVVAPPLSNQKDTDENGTDEESDQSTTTSPPPTKTASVAKSNVTSNPPQEINITVELGLSEAVLARRDPKNYNAWHHRRWAFELCVKEKLLAPEAIKELLNEEIRLCETFLMKDERNFHCWRHLRCIVTLLEDYGVNLETLPAENEGKKVHQDSITKLDRETKEYQLDFSLNCIQRNFSNYSAWHHRTIYLQKTLQQEEQKKNKDSMLTMAKHELGLVRNAIFTEPDDQSAWFYHHWIVDRLLMKSIDGEKRKDNVDEVLLEEIQLIRELLDSGVEEGECRFAHETIARLLVNRTRLGTGTASDIEEARKIYTNLITQDPPHEQRYLYVLSNLKKY
eukprot:g717.t1